VAPQWRSPPTSSSITANLWKALNPEQPHAMTTHTEYASSLQAWKKIGGPQAGTIAALAIGKDANDAGHMIFIGTKVGLFRSSRFDGASVQGWERLTSAPLGIMSLAVSPDFAHDYMIVAGTDSGISISRDGGMTWRPAEIPFSSSMVLTICFSPNYIEDGILLAGTLEDGIWYSHTRGDTWYARSFGLLDATVFSVAISPNFAQDETIYAATDTAIYYSYNSARAWKQLRFPERVAPALSLVLSPDFANDHTVYAGTEKQGLYRSTDQGADWAKLALPAASINALLMSPENKLLAATEVGVFVSRDQGDTWNCLLDIPDVISLVEKNDMVLAGLVDEGAWVTPKLSDWSRVTIPPVRSILGMVLSPQFEVDHVGFMYGLQEGIWGTQDGGNTWERRYEALPSLDIHALALSPEFSHNQTVVASSPDGLFLSHDAGREWQVLAQESAGMTAFSPNGKLLAVAFAEEGIRVTDDLGQSWRKVPGPWNSGGSIVALAVTDTAAFHVALLAGVDDTLHIWQGKPGHFVNVLSQPTHGHAVVGLWIPSDTSASRSWYASLGNTVWKFSTNANSPVAETVVNAESTQTEVIVSLSGIHDVMGETLFACTGQHLYTLPDAHRWNMVHDFGADTAIALAVTPAYHNDKAVYALLLGGTFCKGVAG
jgi:photosystem II stability/assembly factor-like uncharacterized protein